ncbi:MAG: glycosyltransferase [Cyanobacteria bacterium P01_G01_bin.19]
MSKLCQKDKLGSELKIAFIVGRFPVLSEAFILNQIAGLLERGHEVDIYALEGYSRETKVHPIVEKYNLLARSHYVPDIPHNFIFRCLKAIQLLFTQSYKNPLAVIKSFNWLRYGKQALSLRLFYGAIAFLNNQQYDLVHCQFGIYAMQGKYPQDAGVLRLRSLGLLQGKLVIGFRGWDISWYVKQYGEDVYQRLFPHADFFVTNCNFFRDRAIKIGCPGNKITVVGSGIDCQKFQFKPRQLPKDGIVRLATTGRLIEKKGIEYAIRAVADTIPYYPHLEYNIIGDGYLRDSLQQLITELGLTNKIKLLGWKQQAEIISILDNTQIFLAPCITAQDGNQDAPVNTLKEAMAIGLPVISTYHGGIPELVQNGVSGYLVPERDSQAIAEKLQYLIANSNLWQYLGKQGRKFVEQHYDIEPLNDLLVDVYRQTLSIEH